MKSNNEENKIPKEEIEQGIYIPSAYYPEQKEEHKYNPESQIYDMKMLGVLDKAKDLPNYYPPQENNFDLSLSGYYKSIEQALTSDLDQANFTWTMGLNKQQLDEWANLDQNFKDQVTGYAHFRKATIDKEKELQDTAERTIQGEVSKLLFSTQLTGFGAVPDEEQLKADKERIAYLENEDNFRKEVDTIVQKNLKNYNLESYNIIGQSLNMLNATKLSEFKEQELGYGKNILPIAAEIGDVILSAMGPNKKFGDVKDTIKNLPNKYGYAENTTQAITNAVGAAGLAAVYTGFGIVSRTLTAAVNAISPGTIAGWVHNLEEKEIRDYKQAAGDPTSEAYTRLSLYSWEEVKQNAPELAQTYLEFADGDEFRAAAMYMAAKQSAQPEVASFVDGYINTLNQEKLDNIQRILDSKDTLGELLVSGFGAYSKYAVGTLTTGATLLAFDEDAKELALNGDWAGLKQEIKKADYRPSYVLGLENTIAGNAMDLTLSILGDPLTWLLTPGVTSSTSKVLGQFATKSRVGAFVNQTWLGKQITKEMFEVGIKFEKGEIGIRQYNALFNGFDIETQFKFRNVIKESVKNGDKAPTQMFKAVLNEAMLAGQEPLKAYNTLGSLLMGRTFRNVTTSLFGKSMGLPKKLDKFKQFNTAYSNLKQLSTTSPSFLQDASDLVARIIGATVDDFDEQLKLYDNWFQATYDDFSNVSAKGTAANLDEINKVQKQIAVTSDYIAYLEGLSGYKVRNVVRGNNVSATKTSINRVEALDEAQKITSQQKTYQSVIKTLDDKIDETNKSIKRAKDVQKELKSRGDKLSKSEQRTLDAQADIIAKQSERLGKLNKQKAAQQAKIDDLSKEIPAGAEIVEQEAVLFEGVFNAKALSNKLKALNEQIKTVKASAAKTKKRLGADVTSAEKYLSKLRNELSDIELKFNAQKKVGNVNKELKNALEMKTKQVDAAAKKLDEAKDIARNNSEAIETERLLIKYQDEIDRIKEIQKRKTTPVETTAEGQQIVRLDPDLSTTGLQEIFNPETGRIFKEMLDEGKNLSDDVLNKSYEKLLERVKKIDDKTAELYSGLMTSKKNVTKELFKTIRKEHKLARRIAQMQIRKLQSLQKASPQNAIMNMVHDLYADLAVRAGWAKNPNWKATYIIRNDKGRFVKATQAQINAGKAIEIPAVVELVGKNKYKVNWDILRFHMRYDSDITDVGEALLKAGRIGTSQTKPLPVELVGGKLKFNNRTYLGDQFGEIEAFQEFHDVLDTASRILKSHNQIVTAELPISPIEFVLANQAANGNKVSQYLRAAEANEIYRKSQWLNNLWVLDKIAKPSTAVVSNADELMFFNSFGNWKNYFKQSYQSKIDNITLRRFNRVVENGKLAKGEVSPELLKKYEGYVQKQLDNIQKLPALLQQRGLWSEAKFNDAYTILTNGDKGYYDYMISFVNSLLNDYGFQLYSTGNKKAFTNWFATADANYIRGNAILDTLGNNQFYSYTNMTADKAWEMYDGLKHLYTINLKGATADEVWDGLKAAASTRGAGGNPNALPKVSIMTKLQVPGIKGRTGGPVRKFLFGKDQPMLESLFADPANFRQGLISSSAQQKKEAQLISLFESQGKKIINRAELDKVKSQASAIDPIYQTDMYGASYFDYDLFRQGYVTEDYIKAMANRAAVQDVDKYMLNYHLTSPLGRTARQVFPFGKPWLDFTKRYITDLAKRAQIRGLYVSEESNVFTRGLYNMASLSPNLRRGAYISRVANADLSTSQVDFEPFVFLPNGDNFFWVSVPGFGLIPALGLGAIMETTDNENYKKIIETVFPYTVFAPTDYDWKKDPVNTLKQFAMGGGMLSYINKNINMASGFNYNLTSGNESRPFNDSIGLSGIQKDQRSTFYQNLDLVLAQIGNVDTSADALDMIISYAANAELDAILKEFGESGVRYLIPTRVNIGANYLDTADDWIDYFKGAGLLEDILDPDVYEALEKNPNADEPKEQAIQELRNYWYTKSSDAEKILLGLKDPRVYILTQAGYQVTQTGVQELSKAEGGKYTVGQVFRPYLASDPDTLERYEEYVRKGWIAPRSGEDILGYTLYKSFDVRLQAVKLIKEEAANLLNQRIIGSPEIPGGTLVFEPFQEQYVEEYIENWSSEALQGFALVSTDLTVTSDTSDEFLKSYYLLADFSEPTQEIIKLLGLDTLFKNGQVQGNALNNALVQEKLNIVNNKSYIFTAPYQETYTNNPNISFTIWRQNQNAWINGGGMDDYDMVDKSRYQSILDQLDILYSMANDEDFGVQHPKFLELREDTARAFMDFAFEWGSYYNPNDTNLQSWNNQWKDNIESWAGPLEWRAPLPPTAKDFDEPDIFSFDVKGPDGNMIDFQFNVLSADLPKNARTMNVSPLDVIDGDTITIDKFKPVPLRLRVIGIMANELNHPNEDIASEALRQQIFLEELVDISSDRLYYVPDVRFGNDAGKDSYGRELGWLFVEGGIDGNMPAGTGQYIYFEEHFQPTDRYYRRGDELGPFSDIIVPDYNEWDPQTERYILNED